MNGSDSASDKLAAKLAESDKALKVVHAVEASLKGEVMGVDREKRGAEETVSEVLYLYFL